jgi:hypothetical protein
MNADDGRNDVVEQRLPLSLRKALQQYARELARKMRDASSRNVATEQVETKRRPRRRGRAGGAPGLMDIVLARRCLTK